MASIHKEVEVAVRPDKAWTALRQVGEAHHLFAPVLAGCELNGDTRTARFTSGMVVLERILDVDEDRRRVAYTVLDAPGMTFHHASMQILDAPGGHALFVWDTDYLPHEAGPALAPLIEQGATALKRNLEASPVVTAGAPVSEMA